MSNRNNLNVVTINSSEASLDASRINDRSLVLAQSPENLQALKKLKDKHDLQVKAPQMRTAYLENSRKIYSKSVNKHNATTISQKVYLVVILGYYDFNFRAILDRKAIARNRSQRNLS